jgi:hypothetical protein
MAAPGESDVVATDSPSTPKKGSIFEKLKDKTKRAGSRIKSKVGKKKNPDGTDAPVVEGEEHEEEEGTSDDSPSPATPSSPMTSAPRELGSPAFQSEPSRFGSDNDASKEESSPIPDMNKLSLEELTVAKDEPEPSVTEKASEVVNDAVPSGAGATAGALGVDESEEKPVTEKTTEATEDTGAKSEETGDRRYDAAKDGKDAAADKGSEAVDQMKETLAPSESTESKAYEAKDATEPEAMETEPAAESKAYEVKDAVQSKAADVNNATDDSESYTNEATNAAVGTKDAVDSKATDLNNATDDSETYTEKAAEVVQPTSEESPSMMEKVKETLGMNAPSEGSSVVHQAKDQTAPTVESAKESAQGAFDATKGHVVQAKDTVADTATPKQEDKALSEKITETLSALPAKASDTAAGVTQSAKSPTTTTPGTLIDAPAAHSSEPAPGILGKIGGLFGYGAKPHEEHPHDAAH